MSEIQTEIDGVLDELEDEYASEHGIGITVILAVSRGSHAWGLDGPESDYDVGVVYAPLDLRHYAHLGTRESSISREFDGDHDIEVQGWDVTKFAELLAESNEQAIDTLRSPIVYRGYFDRRPLWEYIRESYSPIELYHTYRAIAKNNYRKYLSHHLVDGKNDTYPIVRVDDDGNYLVRNRDTGEEVWIAPDDERYTETQVRQTVKRNLIVASNAMYAEYLRITGERGEHTLPNVDFPTFLDEQAPDVFDDALVETVAELVELKRTGRGSDVVGDLVGYDFAHRPKVIDPSVHAIRRPDPSRLNEFIDSMFDAAGPVSQ
ncbi:DNA polymerase beta superfamily protein [Haloferax namakaokahaiae]|uniref:DNA polymerase beta superfamily protein n=1 Tax=Haloferax namakaokahaiae TaxID=1748331 RepID=A0ABD5ZD18_9EURY